VTSDGVSYYSYLPSIFYYHDLNFYNEFEHYSTLSKPWFDFVREFFIKDGIVMHYFSIGPAILALPFYFLVWTIVKLFAYFGIILSINHLDFLPYLLSYNLASAFYGFLGLILAYKIAIKYFTRNAAFWAVLTVWSGTSAINYFYFEASFSHTFTLFTVSLFIYYWWQTNNDRKNYHWLILGLIGGLMALTRWQESLYMLIPITELIISKKNILNTTKKILILIIGFILAFIPQLIVWKVVYGKFFTIPQGNGFLHYFNPQIIEVIFSSKHGLFIWTPVIFLAIIGLYFLYKKDKCLTTYLVIGLLFQIYINAIAEDWWGGFAFGARRLIDCSVIFILGLSALYNYFEMSKLRLIYKITAILFIIWNILLLIQYRTHLIPGDDYINIWLMVKNQFVLAPIGFVKLLGQSTFLQQLYIGISQHNYLNLLSTLGILFSYLACVYLIIIIVLFINNKEIK
jgi:hypothetical protein